MKHDYENWQKRGNISPNFTYEEITRSATALRRGILNVPDPAASCCLVDLAWKILEPVREQFNIPFSPSSVYRCLKLNRVLGSDDGSQHVLGQAADFEIPTISNYELAAWIRDNMEYDQLILEFYDPDNPRAGWVHCSYVEGKNRKEALIFDGRDYKEFTS